MPRDEKRATVRPLFPCSKWRVNLALVTKCSSKFGNLLVFQDLSLRDFGAASIVTIIRMLANQRIPGMAAYEWTTGSFITLRHP